MLLLHLIHCCKQLAVVSLLLLLHELLHTGSEVAHQVRGGLREVGRCDNRDFRGGQMRKVLLGKLFGLQEEVCGFLLERVDRLHYQAALRSCLFQIKALAHFNASLTILVI